MKDTLDWTPIHHAVKGGIDISDWSRRRFDDNTNQLGTFYFSNLPACEAGLPYAYIQQRGNGHEPFREKMLGFFVQDDTEVTSTLSASLGMRYDWQNYFHDNNDFGPRAALAWAPRRTKNTVIRAGPGLFHDRAKRLVACDPHLLFVYANGGPCMWPCRQSGSSEDR